ncbi:MAG: prepilin-type N-terminal cleavage/methylation domain-containing protein [Clostridiales bacterium]|nr:prepilin-type N-terminal cleavage/methylation domain-containing protein [Clostridiales bacterium]
MKKLKEKFNKSFGAENSNKSGFTLVELIIAVSLLAVVAVTCGMLMSSATNIWSSTDSRERLQYKSTAAQVFLKEYLSDCAAYCDDTIVSNVYDGEGNLTGSSSAYHIFVIKRNDEDLKYLYDFYYDTDEADSDAGATLYLTKTKLKIDPNTGSMVRDSAALENATQPLATGIRSISTQTELYRTANGVDYANNVKLIVTISNSKKQYTKSNLIALRSNPIYVAEKSGANETIADTLIEKYYGVISGVRDMAGQAATATTEATTAEGG